MKIGGGEIGVGEVDRAQVGRGEAGGRAVDAGEVHAGEVLAAEVVAAEIRAKGDVGGFFVRGAVGNDRDGAGLDCAKKARGFGTFLNFDVVDVEGSDGRPARPGDGDGVLIDGDAFLAARVDVVGGDAANAVARVDDRLLAGEKAGRERRDRGDGIDAVSGNEGALVDRDGGRDAGGGRIERMAESSSEVSSMRGPGKTGKSTVCRGGIGGERCGRR